MHTPWSLYSGGSICYIPLSLAQEQILDMSHRERHTWVKEINRINDRINTSR